MYNIEFIVKGICCIVDSIQCTVYRRPVHPYGSHIVLPCCRVPMIRTPNGIPGAAGRPPASHSYPDVLQGPRVIVNILVSYS